MMVEALLDKYSSDPVEVFTLMIKRIAGGEIKVFGLVTPNTLVEALYPILEEIAVCKENDHFERKGYGQQETGIRNNATFSDALRKNFEGLKVNKANPPTQKEKDYFDKIKN